ncbi:unnamed protein product [Rhizophagus irregularis]|uniref:Uncharacterized protein n=1 Tax=Rhizophagus irregularis TaxID=588596 RepID=A0A916EL04_9GLOM|nr:unnamed protein product [Rhizophagus irregularis]
MSSSSPRGCSEIYIFRRKAHITFDTKLPHIFNRSCTTIFNCTPRAPCFAILYAIKLLWSVISGKVKHFYYIFA